MNPKMAAKSMTITGPKNKRYTLQKTVIPRGTSRNAKKNEPTASQVRIRTDKTPRLLLGFSIVSAKVLMEQHSFTKPFDLITTQRALAHVKRASAKIRGERHSHE